MITALVWFYAALLVGLSISLLRPWWREQNRILDEQIEAAFAASDFERWEKE